MLETVFLVVLALALLGTMIWAADKYIEIPGPFGWFKGLLIFAIVVVACWLIWAVATGHAVHGHLVL